MSHFRSSPPGGVFVLLVVHEDFDILVLDIAGRPAVVASVFTAEVFAAVSTSEPLKEGSLIRRFTVCSREMSP